MKTWRALLVLLLISLLGACASWRTPPPPDMAVVVQWNELALNAVRNEAIIRPTAVSRQLFLLHAAMYDAWSAFSPTARPYALPPTVKIAAEQRNEAAKRAAVSQAAYHILTHEFPRFERNGEPLRSYMNRLGIAVVYEGDPNTPSGIGYLAAQAVLQARRDDGANAVDGGVVQQTSVTYPQLYAPVNSDELRLIAADGQPAFNPNHWQPLRVPYPSAGYQHGRFQIDPTNRASYDIQTFLTPHWGAVRPFALTSGAELRPPPPPQYDSTAPYRDALGKTTSNDQAYRQQADEIVQITAQLDDRQKVIAEFWADGPRSESPPGHWNQLAHGLSQRDRHTLDQDVQMYFALNAALLDAGIATWECKRYYDYVRPVSAIRFLYYDKPIPSWGGPRRGTVILPGKDWHPYQQQTFVTPGFPEYVSGHSAFSAAAATVLIRFTGSDRFYDGVTRTDQDIDRDGESDLLGQFVFRAGFGFIEKGPAENVILRWPTLTAAADEAGYSRRLGGIHFQDGDLRGRELGRQVGERVYAKARSYWQ